MILLRDVLVLLPALAQALQPAESQLLKAIHGTVEHPVFAEMQQHVEAVIDEVCSLLSTRDDLLSNSLLSCRSRSVQGLGQWSVRVNSVFEHVLRRDPTACAVPSRLIATHTWLPLLLNHGACISHSLAVLQDARTAKSAFVNRTQQCFAVKGTVNDFLDLARSTYCRLTEEIYLLADKYREEHALPNLKVCAAGPDQTADRITCLAYLLVVPGWHACCQCAKVHGDSDSASAMPETCIEHPMSLSARHQRFAGRAEGKEHRHVLLQRATKGIRPLLPVHPAAACKRIHF